MDNIEQCLEINDDEKLIDLDKKMAFGALTGFVTTAATTTYIMSSYLIGKMPDPGILDYTMAIAPSSLVGIGAGTAGTIPGGMIGALTWLAKRVKIKVYLD